MKRTLPSSRPAGKLAIAARLGALAAVVIAATFGMARTTSADPSFGYGGLGPGVNAIVFDTGNGGPVFAPVPPAAPVFPPPAFGLGPAANMDALSYGDNPFPPPGPWNLAFTVGPGATGHPFTPPPVSPMYPNIPAELGAGDGTVVGDIYSSFAMPSFVFPPGAYAFAAPPPAPCGPIHNNIQIADDDGVGPFALGFPNVGLSTFAPGSNLDVLEMNDNSFVDFLPPGGDGVLDVPVFFSVDPPTAAGLPLLPPFFVATTAADVLAWNPATGLLYNWAPAGLLGLVAGDNIDGLAVGYISGAPIPGGWIGPPDTILLSLAPGSPSLAGIASACYGPGTAAPGDVLVKFAPGPPPAPAVDAEMMGLNTIRSGGGANDNLEDFDLIVAGGIDGDGDFIDDAIDLDDDNDGLGDMYDTASGCSPVIADTDGDSVSDYDEVVTYGTNCAVADTDGDGCTDDREIQTAPGSELSGGIRNPLNPNDYFNPSGDLKNRVDDILLTVLQYFMDDLDGNPGLPPYFPGYTPVTDRTLKGPDLWRTGPPNGLQRVDDILNSVNSYFHDCV